MPNAAGLAVSNIAWDPRDNDAAAALLRNERCGGVEIAPTKWREKPLQATPSDIASFRAYWQERGLRIVALQALLFGRPDLQVFGPADVRGETLAYLRGIIDLGAALGATSLVFGSPKNRVRGTLSVAEALKIAIPFFRTLGEHAETHGVVFCIEPNPPRYGCDFVTTTAEAVVLAERVGRAGFGIQGDLGTLAINEEDVAESLALAKPHVKHFHISEPDLAKVGSGGVDHYAAAEAIERVGYTGWLSIETKEGGTLASLTNSIRLAKQAYGRLLG